MGPPHLTLNLPCLFVCFVCFLLCLLCFFCFVLFLWVGLSLLRFAKNKVQKDKIDHFLKLKNWSNRVAQHAWTSFWLTIVRLFFGCCKNMLRPLYSVLGKNVHFLSPPPKIRNTICEPTNNILGCFFCIFVLGGVCAVSVFCLSWEQWKTKRTKLQNKTRKKKDHKMQTRNHVGLL